MNEPNRATDAPNCAEVLVRPVQGNTPAPCGAGCASGSDVRQWIGIVAQRGKLGLSDDEAFARAWQVITDANPFPSTLGRICPHPCETACNREGTGGAVAVNALERFLGDWALQRGLPLAPLAPATRCVSIGVIGAGPAGLSFAYQLARRGHRVTVYDKRAHAGGMLQHGIPAYRLPKQVLQAEIDRIVALGVALELDVAIGRDLPIDELRVRHELLFLGIGTGEAERLGVPGEAGPGVLSGIAFLDAVNRGEPAGALGEVVVVGGGNTAIDAARTARRLGSDVTLVYRRTREEMPAIAADVDEAIAEGVRLELLAAPAAVRRADDGHPCALEVQRMTLGEPDASGRRRPVPAPEPAFDIPARTVIVAVSQRADFAGLGGIDASTIGDMNATAPEGAVWTGGDVLGAGIAGVAIAQGRQAAEAVAAMIEGIPRPAARVRSATMAEDALDADFPAQRPRVHARERPVTERLGSLDLEVHDTISQSAFLDEIERCHSCGQCHGCQYCYMYCNVGGFVRLDQVQPGAYFALSLERCMGCGKCIDLCPTGFLSGAPVPAGPAAGG